MTMLEQTPPPAEQPLLEVKDLVQRYTLPRESMFKPAGQVHALNGVTAQVMAGRSLGVVGEVRIGQVDLRAAGDGAGSAVVGLGVADGPRPAPDAGRRVAPRPA